MINNQTEDGENQVFLTVDEAAVYLGIKKVTIYSHIKRGKLTAYTQPLNAKRRWLKKSDLEELRGFRPVNQVHHPTALKTE
jgi:excisionase family DNA binding protein